MTKIDDVTKIDDACFLAPATEAYDIIAMEVRMQPYKQWYYNSNQLLMLVGRQQGCTSRNCFNDNLLLLVLY